MPCLKCNKPLTIKTSKSPDSIFCDACLKGKSMTDKFQIKDSGRRQDFAGGFIRDVTTGKINYSLIADGPMFTRWAQHLTTGAEKYEPRNWMQAQDIEAYNRFKESAFRHFMQWFYGDREEDHAAAVFFNINGAEYVRDKGITPKSTSSDPLAQCTLLECDIHHPKVPNHKKFTGIA